MNESSLKRIFYVDVGKIPKTEAEYYIRKLIRKHRDRDYLSLEFPSQSARREEQLRLIEEASWPEGWTDELESEMNRTMFDVFEWPKNMSDKEYEAINRSRRHRYLWFKKQCEEQPKKTLKEKILDFIEKWFSMM